MHVITLFGGLPRRKYLEICNYSFINNSFDLFCELFKCFRLDAMEFVAVDV